MSAYRQGLRDLFNCAQGYGGSNPGQIPMLGVKGNEVLSALEAAEHELTAMAARCGELTEALTDMREAMIAKHGCYPLDRVTDTQKQVTAAMDKAEAALAQPLPARAAAVGAVVEAARMMRPTMLSTDAYDDLRWINFCKACDALAKLDGAA